MTQDDFDRLQTLLASRAGFRLTRDRIHLAEHRLGPVARREGFDTVEALLGSLWVKPVASLAWSVIEAMLNAETWFRRDRAPFDTFANEILPAIGRVRPEGLVRVWSAGCSTGQEPYSLAMAALDARANTEIVATDLSQRAIDRARTGVFTGFEIQRGLSVTSMLKWFEPAEEQWRASQSLRESVRFARANLLDDVSESNRFDVIFCRHVLTDVEPARRGQIIDGLERWLVDDGVLFLGPDERLDGDTVAFRPVNGRKGLFVKTPSALSRAA
ncbi:CheR family methyltransferase [Brevundimonas variabilis]|uniref:Chemotaxis protein methyltransferase CheR n=1 Tax=Brevundimonas variabilis TaxID=74312 RepID=A0A7W9CFB6_9CAUL|nr:protein-glutamate O-methyltransferase CheR [Brevundimonas variabilis]MBB5744590.1 chemotaxis protein methyltransferase CheR [Brevundimonas variabilis]